MKRVRRWKDSKADIVYERKRARGRARGVAIGITVNTAWSSSRYFHRTYMRLIRRHYHQIRRGNGPHATLLEIAHSIANEAHVNAVDLLYASSASDEALDRAYAFYATAEEFLKRQRAKAVAARSGGHRNDDKTAQTLVAAPDRTGDGGTTVDAEEQVAREIGVSA